jgi:hypothetical protein
MASPPMILVSSSGGSTRSNLPAMDPTRRNSLAADPARCGGGSMRRGPLAVDLGSPVGSRRAHRRAHVFFYFFIDVPRRAFLPCPPP